MSLKRVIIERVQPSVDEGAYPVKRTIGEIMHVSADMYCDGHDDIRANLLFRKKGEIRFREIGFKPLQNDRWEAFFHVTEKGIWEFKIQAWADPLFTWLKNIHKKIQAEQTVRSELLEGSALFSAIRKRKKLSAKHPLVYAAELLKDEERMRKAVVWCTGEECKSLLTQYANPVNFTETSLFTILCETRKAEFSTWYEVFPRSTSNKSGKHGTLKDVAALIPFIARQGFDVVYLPPIHPIGFSHRKGKNNNPSATPDEPGSPWAIGNLNGGHKSIHPELGTEADFRHLIDTASKKGIDIALDFAIQCSPDHPWVKEHPQWFKWRPDGTVQYAENPPKKYQDVLPVNFETSDYHALRDELKSVLEYWIELGVRIFRVDNPHTKPFAFWEWLIAELRKKNPDLIFLSEAFTRPKIMNHLAKIGFSQSYTYFTWRIGKQELTDYLNELVYGEQRQYFRPNFWPTTPDILPYDLQNKGYEACAIRFVLAATLSASYGLYGPAFELLETKPFGSKEEFLDSEKYEIKNWDWETDTPMRQLIRKVNHARKVLPALQQTFNISFCETDNPQIMAYLKISAELKSYVLVVVNLDAQYKQSGHVRIPIDKLGITEPTPLHLNDHISAEHYTWEKTWNYVALDPLLNCAHILELSW